VRVVFALAAVEIKVVGAAVAVVARHTPLGLRVVEESQLLLLVGVEEDRLLLLLVRIVVAVTAVVDKAMLLLLLVVEVELLLLLVAVFVDPFGLQVFGWPGLQDHPSGPL